MAQDPTFKDLAYRGLAAALGGPVDLTTMVMRPFGYDHPDEQVVGSSEWIGSGLEDLGLVSSARSPLGEFLSSMAVPTPSGVAKGTALAAAGMLGSMKGIGKADDALSRVDDFAYRGSHRASGPDSGAPLYDLTGGGDYYPSDVYSNKAVQYYGTGYPAADKEAFALASRVRGKPEAQITIYRAVPNDDSIESINIGDWVTLSKNYAKTHGESALMGDYKIIAQKAKAKDVFTSADSIHEFGYYPQ